MKNLIDILPDNDYFLLTPGPLSTSKTVKAAMLKDYCTWDDDYNNIVQEVRGKLVDLAVRTNKNNYTTVLMQGSGTFSVESIIGSTVAEDDKLLIVSNGAYGERIVTMAEYLKINHTVLRFNEVDVVDPLEVEKVLENDSEISYVSVVHCETTTGILNPVKEIGKIVKKHNKRYFVDAMSSFGGIEFDMEDIGADFMVSSANKCIQGVPGFGFIIARVNELMKCKGRARSLSLDLYDQWETMEKKNGKWRYTSPTHVVRGFLQAIKELDVEGGISAREKRYRENHKVLVEGMRSIGFKTLLSDDVMSPIITSFYYPETSNFNFLEFYHFIKNKGFVIYPGKISQAATFRIGNIGHLFPDDMKLLIEKIREVSDVMNLF